MTAKKTGFPFWEDRIAPVFDIARRILIVETASGRVIAETEATLGEGLPGQKAIRLTELGIDILVCGAISNPLRAQVEAYGIRVLPFIAGGLREVVRAWIGGTLERGGFAMPGCPGPGRWCRRGSRHRDSAGHPGPVQARRTGRGGYGRGCRAGSSSGESRCYWICPSCGQREPRVPGIENPSRLCPKCGAAMMSQ